MAACCVRHPRACKGDSGTTWCAGSHSGAGKQVKKNQPSRGMLQYSEACKGDMFPGSHSRGRGSGLQVGHVEWVKIVADFSLFGFICIHEASRTYPAWRYQRMHCPFDLESISADCVYIDLVRVAF